MTVRVVHDSPTGAAANPRVLVDGPKWDADHVVTGLENVPNVDTSNAENVYFTQDGTGAVARSVAARLKEIVDIRDFAPSGSGTHDDRALIQLAINQVPDGGELYVSRPSVGFVLDSVGTNGHVLTIPPDKSITIRGEGFNINTDGLYAPRGCVFMLGPSLPTTADILYFTGTRAVFGSGLENIGFTGITNAFHELPVGRNILHIDANGANDFYHQYFRVKNVFFCNTATGYSVKTTATALNNGGGALCNAKFKDVAWMCSKLDYVGDSITFDNITSGQNATDDARNIGCIFNQVSGGTSVRFLGGNWSNFNGTIICDGGVSPLIFAIEAELGQTTVNSHGSMIDMRGAISTVFSPVITSGCTISQNSNVADYIPVRIGNVQDAFVGAGVRIAQRRVTGTHVTVTSGSSGANIDAESIHFYTSNGVDLVGVISDTGAYTRVNGRFTTKIPGGSAGFQYFKGPVTGLGGILSLPASVADDVLLANNVTATMLGKTFDTAGAGNSFLINGVAVTANNGTGPVLRETNPIITGGQHNALTSFGLRSTGAAFDLKMASAEVFTGNHTLTWSLGNADRTLTLGGNATLNGGTHSGTNTGDQTITLTGDVTGSGTGSFAAIIGATKVTSAMLNADVFSTAHSWAGQQTFVAPVLGTPASGVATNLTGTAAGLTAGTATAVAVGGITGLGTGVATSLALNVGSAGAPVTFNGALGTPSGGTATNLTGTASGLTAGNVTTNANLTGDVTSVGNATTLTNAPVIAKVLTGYASGAGTVSAADSILSAIQKLNGNDATNANLTGDVTSVGNATTLTNAPVIAKVLTGYASGAGTVSAADSILSAIQKLNGNDATNANLTGVITSVGNATSIASQTGTGSKFVVDTAPTINNPNIVGTATNDSAAAGSVGEYNESVVLIGSPVALTSATAKTVTSITLSAGDWDVTGAVFIIPAATTSITQTAGSISTTTNTNDITPGRFGQKVFAAVVTAGFVLSESVGPSRFSVTGSTTVFLVAQSTFTVSTNAAYGIIRARRVR